MTDDYQDLLNKSWDEIPKILPLPEGTYMLRGRNATYKEPKGDGNPFVLFVYEPQRPLDDVDEDALAELGPDYDVQDNRIFARIWVETAGDWDVVRQHLAKHGIDVENSTIGNSLKAFKGTEVLAYLGQRSFQNAAGETQVENEAKSFAPVED